MAFSSHFFKGMHQLWLSTKIMYCGCYFVHMAVIVFVRSLHDKSLPRSIFYSLEVNNYVPCTLKVWGVMFHFLEGGVSMEDVWNSSAQICPLSFICWFIYLFNNLFIYVSFIFQYHLFIWGFNLSQIWTWGALLVGFYVLFFDTSSLSRLHFSSFLSTSYILAFKDTPSSQHLFPAPTQNSSTLQGALAPLL